ncbi:hypothetical protein TCAL_03549 [Tigriopus californicus]|uniref:protein xylosyltransferase n=1 Tax=Tigriopus californicus TaxID=6832 RepID=A0A553NCN3_TIGCA|nr:xylosyltransferase oxt-like [Tigriopus californicus]XP_059092177.1 xylosyltransferase oxt-like [Tigriopus californicus]XP_059092178.1 xylosyltransferase oxt-like [Tigriopus californicus]XP_059092179.1 xylosyltransferase oxt-like [Tigriopus californicus]TRY63197.1 hypothetical protein TCAL_03549 [Tigriopus californicus]|eukprot:TCALIF_03549-PA protein Name:"Similar to oxt Xylosyltransferase oxt (Drosophila melanogaster)" AED:0.10 eAED:0.11 QI:0/-1/0/1/-1/1/1/0/921
MFRTRIRSPRGINIQTNPTSVPNEEVRGMNHQEDQYARKVRKAGMELKPNPMGSWTFGKKIQLIFLVLIALFGFQLMVGILFSSWENKIAANAPSTGVPASSKTTTVSPAISDNNTEWYFEEYDVWVNCPQEEFGKDAKSALLRAKSKSCRSQIANVTCLAARSQLFPTYLRNQCAQSTDSRVVGTHLGCYKDSFSSRILNGGMTTYKTMLGKQKCLMLCTESGYLYAGLQYGSECFCGSERPNDGDRFPPEKSKCNYPCAGNPKENCGGYLAMDVYQTGLIPLRPAPATQEIKKALETPVRVVYLLTLSGRAVRQVRRLIRRLYHVDNYFLIHVDSRQDYLYRELLPLESQFRNIRLVQDRMATIWGGSSLLQMLLHCMKHLLTLDWDWSFVMNLSESDYPIKDPQELVHFLTINRGRNFVKSHGRDAPTFIKKQGMDKTFVECDNHMYRIGSRQIPMGIQIDGGSDWVCLHRDFVQYLTHGSDETLEGLKRFFNFALLPAEAFFHIVLKNTEFCSTILNNNLHLTNWNRKQGCKCQHKAVVDWCGCSPNDFKPSDWNRLLGAEKRPLYFGRKFEPVINQEILFQVDQWIYGDDFQVNLTSVHSFWQNIFHHQDTSPAPKIEYLSVASSLIQDFLDQQSPKIGFDKVLEITSYQNNDRLQGILVLFLSSEPSVAAFEVLIKLSFQRKTVQLQDFNIDIRVGSEYDKKEQVFRNLFEVMEPESDPHLMYQSDPFNSTHVITFAWFDPKGTLSAVSDKRFYNASSVLDAIPSGLSRPLHPGMWTVQAIVNGQMKAEIQFPIFPILPSLIPDQKQWEKLHEGSVSPKDISTFEIEPKFVALSKAHPSLSHPRFSPKLSNSDADVQAYINDLASAFFTVKSICAVSLDQTTVQSPLCHDQPWSSFSPDPKSKITEINPDTGLLS